MRYQLALSLEPGFYTARVTCVGGFNGAFVDIRSFSRVFCLVASCNVLGIDFPLSYVSFSN